MPDSLGDERMHVLLCHASAKKERDLTEQFSPRAGGGRRMNILRAPQGASFGTCILGLLHGPVFEGLYLVVFQIGGRTDEKVAEV